MVNRFTIIKMTCFWPSQWVHCLILIQQKSKKGQQHNCTQLEFFKISSKCSIWVRDDRGFVCVQCWFSETAKSLLVITTALVCLVPVTARPHNVPEHWNLFKNLFHIIEGVTDFGYSRVRNKRTPTFIKFWNFFQGLWSYYGLKRLQFYYISLHILRGYVYYFCQIFQRLRLFKGLRLFRTLE